MLKLKKKQQYQYQQYGIVYQWRDRICTKLHVDRYLYASNLQTRIQIYMFLISEPYNFTIYMFPFQNRVRHPWDRRPSSLEYRRTPMLVCTTCIIDCPLQSRVLTPHPTHPSPWDRRLSSREYRRTPMLVCRQCDSIGRFMGRYATPMFGKFYQKGYFGHF